MGTTGEGYNAQSRVDSGVILPPPPSLSSSILASSHAPQLLPLIPLLTPPSLPGPPVTSPGMPCGPTGEGQEGNGGWRMMEEVYGGEDEGGGLW